jgi:hypothetical protein
MNKLTEQAHYSHAQEFGKHCILSIFTRRDLVDAAPEETFGVMFNTLCCSG